MSEKVVVRKVEDLKKDIRNSLDLLGFEANDRDFVVIKPNLCDFRPCWEGGTTDPAVVEALIGSIFDMAHPRIAIVESNHAVANASDEFERLGYKDLAGRLGVELINLSDDKVYDVVLNGHYFDTLEAPETLLKATKIISVAKMKTHAQQKITCNLKNLFGLLPRKAKGKFHPYMNEVLADLAEFYRPSLCIIDGIVGMEGFGPSDGDKKDTGIIICGMDAVSTDAVAARLMGFDPKGVPNLKFAEKCKLGMIEDIDIDSNVDLNSIEKFKFIPFYSYWPYRISFSMERVRKKIDNVIKSVSTFVSQTSIGFMVLIKGSHVSSELGMLLARHAIMYAEGMIKRIFILVKMKLERI